MPGMILCPTRGGKASYPNQDRAIAIAKEREADLLFLYVSNVKFLGLTALPKVVDIETELDEMGDFLLTMAQERASKAGVKAYTTVHRGIFQTILREVIKEYQVETIVLGSSEKGSGFTTPDYIHRVAEKLNRETGLEILILHEGKIMQSFSSREESNST